ncbi:alpha/beta fold hydrolase [Variimorphobacter saccharofermentans]|nr:alpha/beta fold hydrolase [Variimorphobacter saccharofermentans]
MMKDYTKMLPEHTEMYIGEQDLFLEIYEGEVKSERTQKRPPLLFVHGAYTGSWMWSKYIPHFVKDGWRCYVMNYRGHYKSRSVDISRVTFQDYLEDIREVIANCGEKPIIIGFSLGGILCQKVAETADLKGLVLIDSCISKEVNERVPYDILSDDTLGMIVPAPARNEVSSVDESEEDIEFQRKYLSMESSKALLECGCWIRGIKGVSIDNSLITCPTLIIKSVNNQEDDRRGIAEAEHLKGDYAGYWNTTHTGLLVGQRYHEIVAKLLEWLNNIPKESWY